MFLIITDLKFKKKGRIVLTQVTTAYVCFTYMVVDN